MDQLQNELYHHSKSVSLQQLPPTSSATRLVHILRAVYATNEMVSLLFTTHDGLDPTQYGFEEVDGLLTPKMDAVVWNDVTDVPTVAMIVAVGWKLLVAVSACTGARKGATGQTVWRSTAAPRLPCGGPCQLYSLVVVTST